MGKPPISMFSADMHRMTGHAWRDNPHDAPRLHVVARRAQPDEAISESIKAGIASLQAASRSSPLPSATACFVGSLADGHVPKGQLAVAQRSDGICPKVKWHLPIGHFVKW
jgi:hypothetical protein